MDEDTIAALSTPMGRGGIAVIRISGDRTALILKMIVDKFPESISPGRVYHGFVISNGKKLDECMVVLFKSPRSYTGEDLAEISIHSNPFVIEDVLDLIFSHGARQAMAGEFTYRAFKHGKLDLIQAEGVNELINANSKFFARIQMENIDGKLSVLIGKLKGNLTELGIRIETYIEFEEDQFLKRKNIMDIGALIPETLKILEHILSHAMLNEALNRGLQVVIAGKENVGKSSLFNCLLMEERAIISEKPGTTRDFIKDRIYVDGFPFEVIDIAGINLATRDEIESQGIRRGYEKINSSDAVIFMVDASAGIDGNDMNIFEQLKSKKKIIVANKIDIMKKAALSGIQSSFKGEKILKVSARENRGTDKIFSFFRDLLKSMEKEEFRFSFSHRQKALFIELDQATKKISDMLESKQSNGDHVSKYVEIIAEEIRHALHIIGQLTGEVSNQDILNGIFSRFCVGK
jgi:tRNA modification GTPase